MRSLLLRLLVLGLLTTGGWLGPAALVHGQEGEGSDPSLPIARGEPGTVGDYVVTVVEVVPDATDLVLEHQPYNDPPAAGAQFFLVRVAVTYTGTATGKPNVELLFSAIGEADVVYTEFDETSCGSVPEPQFFAPQLPPGETTEFNVCWAVPTADAGSLVMSVTTLLTGGPAMWFALDAAAADRGQATPALGDESPGSSREQPVPLGSAGQVGDYMISVVEVVPDASEMILAANAAHEPPADGWQYYLVRVAVTNAGSSSSSPGQDLNVQAIGDRSETYAQTSPSCAPVFEESLQMTNWLSTLEPGAHGEYTVCWEVPSEDVASLVMFISPGLFPDPAEATWFVLTD